MTAARTHLWLATLILAISVSAVGCCGTELCAVRFDRVDAELCEEGPESVPYHEPPIGFRTIGGPPALAEAEYAARGPAHQHSPIAKFHPVPTRPVFAPAAIPPMSAPLRGPIVDNPTGAAADREQVSSDADQSEPPWELREPRELPQGIDDSEPPETATLQTTEFEADPPATHDSARSSGVHTISHRMRWLDDE